MSLYLLCKKRHKDVTYKLIFVKKDQICDIYIVENPSQNTRKVLFLEGVSGIVLYGTHEKFEMSFHDQNNKQIWNPHWGEFIVSRAEISFTFGLDGGGNNRNELSENLWETELDWGRLAADKDKLYVGSREFINHFRPYPTPGNPYICLI